MIKFFRKIRSKFIFENKVGKYLLYALGEIILVVIGILIALEINNRNETHKERLYEGKILVEIYNGLRADSARLADWIRPRVDRKLSGIQLMGEYINSGVYPGDSVFMETYHRFHGSMQVSMNFGPYQTLKTNGLNKVNSAAVRFWLVDLYESLLPRQLAFIDASVENNKDYLFSVRRELLIPKLGKSDSGEFFDYRTPKSNNILKDERFMQLFRVETEIADQHEYRVRIITKAVNMSLEKLKNYFASAGINYEQEFTTKMKGIRDMIDDDAIAVQRR